MTKVLILYSEVMPYNIACFQELVNIFNVEVHLIHWINNKLTPYQVPDSKDIFLYEREAMTNSEMINLSIRINPSLVFVSGWMDKGYLKICQILKKNRIPILCGIDTQCDYSIKQNLTVFVRKLYLVRKYFSHCYVPGIKQYEFARKIGFKSDEIIIGALSADTKLFVKNTEKIQIYKKILFVGRFNKIKGIDLLCKCFLEIINQNERFSDWELILIGNGPEKEYFPQSTQIKIFDFLPQPEILKIIGNVDFFCLPSRREPWGVVVHEMASAGLPLLLSDSCGASTDYLIEGFNGYSFKRNDDIELKEKLITLMSSTMEGLKSMGEKSYLLSLNNSPEIWAYKVFHLLNK